MDNGHADRIIPHHPIVEELEPLEDIVHAPLIGVNVECCHIVVEPGRRFQSSQAHIGTAFPVGGGCCFSPILLKRGVSSFCIS